jgi:hypothetical protein
MSVKPELIKAGDARVKLGIYNESPKVDIRVVAEDEYQRMIKLLERAEMLVGNPATNISSSTDLACESWQKDYQEWKS